MRLLRVPLRVLRELLRPLRVPLRPLRTLVLRLPPNIRPAHAVQPISSRGGDYLRLLRVARVARLASFSGG